MDHPSFFAKIGPLLGDQFILHSSWNTMVPAGSPGGGFHQDASGPSLFRNLATPAPLVQVRVGFVLTDLSQPNCGNLIVVPGSHNASVPLPPDSTDYSMGSSSPDGADAEDGAHQAASAAVEQMHPISSAIPLCAKAGSAILFHQALWHTGGPNLQPYHPFSHTSIYSTLAITQLRAGQSSRLNQRR